MNRLLCLTTIIFLVIATTQSQAGMIEQTLGVESSLTDGQYTLTEYINANTADPFGAYSGFDDLFGGPTYTKDFTFNVGPITDPILSATLMLGLYDHDSNSTIATSDQVANFTLDTTNDLTGDLNTLLNASGGTDVFIVDMSTFPFTVVQNTSEYNIYTLNLTGAALTALLDGIANFSLTLQNGHTYFLGNSTDTPNNSAGLDFAKLTINTQDSNAVVPEPASLLMFGMGGLGLIGGARRRKKRLDS